MFPGCVVVVVVVVVMVVVIRSIGGVGDSVCSKVLLRQVGNVPSRECVRPIMMKTLALCYLVQDAKQRLCDVFSNGKCYPSDVCLIHNFMILFYRIFFVPCEGTKTILTEPSNKIEFTHYL